MAVVLLVMSGRSFNGEYSSAYTLRKGSKIALMGFGGFLSTNIHRMCM
jgi:hypothetical protein